MIDLELASVLFLAFVSLIYLYIVLQSLAHVIEMTVAFIRSLW